MFRVSTKDNVKKKTPNKPQKHPILRPSKKMFWFSDNGFKKKGKVGRVFIFCFYFQSNMGRVLYFVFIFSSLKT